MGEQTRKQLITVDQFRELARPTSVHLDENEVNAYIRESEDKYIIPFLGYKNFKAAAEGIVSVWDETFDDTFSATLLLDGGEWEDDKHGKCGCSDEVLVNYCNGMRKALAYFVYARMIRADGSILTRSGAMRHNDDYANHDNDPKLNQYNDTMDMAERYISECMEYCKYHAKDKQIRSVRGSRLKFHVIGN